MSKYKNYLSIKINEEEILDIKYLIPNLIKDDLTKENIFNYFYNNLYDEIDKIYNTDNYKKIYNNKYNLKTKYEFLQYFNILNKTNLYKFINFYYNIIKNYDILIKNKKLNNYYINWDCYYKQIKNGLIENHELIDIYNDYQINKNNNEDELYNFYKILNISLEIWNDFFLVYLNRFKKSDIKNNSFYKNIILKSINKKINIDNYFNENDIFDFRIFIDNYNEEELLKNVKKISISNNNYKTTKLEIKENKKEKDFLIFQYVEVKNEDKFEFNFNFLNEFKNYPDTLFKEKDKKLEYILNENKKINIIGWYKNEDYTINKNLINEIYYNNKIIINENKNLYIYVLFEYN